MNLMILAMDSLNGYYEMVFRSCNKNNYVKNILFYIIDLIFFNTFLSIVIGYRLTE